jgi:hypothetical protein
MLAAEELEKHTDTNRRLQRLGYHDDEKIEKARRLEKFEVVLAEAQKVSCPSCGQPADSVGFDGCLAMYCLNEACDLTKAKSGYCFCCRAQIDCVRIPFSCFCTPLLQPVTDRPP